MDAEHPQPDQREENPEDLLNNSYEIKSGLLIALRAISTMETVGRAARLGTWCVTDIST